MSPIFITNTLYFCIFFIFLPLFNILNKNYLRINIKYINLNKFLTSFIFSFIYINILIYKDNIITSFVILFLVFRLMSLIFSKEHFKLLTLTFASYYLIIISFCVTFTLYEILFETNIYDILNGFNVFIFILFLISIFLYLLLFKQLKKKVFDDIFDYIIQGNNYGTSILIFTILIWKNYSIFYVLNFSRHSIEVSMIIFVMFALELLVIDYILNVVKNSYNLSIYKHKNKILNMQYELQLSSYKQLDSYHESIKKISHDLKNHKTVLYNLIASKDYDQALDYLNEYNLSISEHEDLIFTTNKILNSLLVKLHNDCIDNKIELNLIVEIPKSISISDFDICILFGNLSDNAVEACLRVDNDSIKSIDVIVKVVNNNFVLELKNTFNGSLNKSNGKFLTSKKDTLNHGIGLTNIESTIKKYNGTYEVEYDASYFSSFIMIPL